MTKKGNKFDMQQDLSIVLVYLKAFRQSIQLNPFHPWCVIIKSVPDCSMTPLVFIKNVYRAYGLAYGPIPNSFDSHSFPYDIPV